MKFDTTIRTSGGDIQVTLHEGSTMADLRIISADGRNEVTVYCNSTGLTELASACGASVHDRLEYPVEVETEAGVIDLGQPAGLVTMSPRIMGPDFTVSDRTTTVTIPLDSGNCSQLGVAFAAAAHNL